MQDITTIEKQQWSPIKHIAQGMKYTDLPWKEYYNNSIVHESYIYRTFYERWAGE